MSFPQLTTPRETHLPFSSQTRGPPLSPWSRVKIFKNFNEDLRNYIPKAIERKKRNLGKYILNLNSRSRRRLYRALDIRVLIRKRTNKRNERTSERASERTIDVSNEPTNEQPIDLTNERMDGQQTYGWSDWLTDGRTDGRQPVFPYFMLISNTCV